MPSPADQIRRTRPSKAAFAARIVAGAPLAFFGVMHLIGVMPMAPLLEEAGLPAPGAMAILASLGQLTAGVLLLSGAFARVGGLTAIGTMVGALITHALIANDAWPTKQVDGTIVPGPEPVEMMVIAVVILLAGAVVMIKGAGSWGIDSAATPAPSNTDNANTGGRTGEPATA